MYLQSIMIVLRCFLFRLLAFLNMRALSSFASSIGQIPAPLRERQFKHSNLYQTTFKKDMNDCLSFFFLQKLLAEVMMLKNSYFRTDSKCDAFRERERSLGTQSLITGSIPFLTPTDKGKRGLSVSLWFEKNLIVWQYNKDASSF